MATAPTAPQNATYVQHAIEIPMYTNAHQLSPHWRSNLYPHLEPYHLLPNHLPHMGGGWALLLALGAWNVHPSPSPNEAVVLGWNPIGCPHGGDVSSVPVRDSPPPPPPGPPGPLSYQGSMATDHTYGGAEGARKFFFHSPCPRSIPPRPGGGAPQRYT